MSFDERTVVARVERLTLRELRLWVREGWVRPGLSTAGPVFDEIDIARIHLLCDLRKDMSVPSDVMNVVLMLIDQLNQTRRDLRSLTEALDGLPAETRQSVIATLRDRQG